MSIPDWLVAKPIAHRGLHNKAEGIIENTASAAEAAIARGFPIELDVQLTADNEAIVFHDFELERYIEHSSRYSARSSGDRHSSRTSFQCSLAGIKCMEGHYKYPRYSQSGVLRLDSQYSAS